MDSDTSGVFSRQSLDVLRRSRLVLALTFGVCFSAIYAIDTQIPRALVLEARTNTTAVAQLFYDIGEGVKEDDSVAVPVTASPRFTTVSFRLPVARIQALRFDPLNRPGTFSLRHARIVGAWGMVLHQFTSSDFTALNQISTRVDAGEEVRFSTEPGANDPILQIALHDPISQWPPTSILVIQALVGLLVTGLTAAVSVVVRNGNSSIGRVMDRWALAVSDAEFVRVDRFAIGCYLAIVVVFVVSVSAALHGSSISLYSTMPSLTNEPALPLLGTGKPIRSDEWAYHTPAILHQVYRAVPLDAKLSAPGPGYASLFANIPARHLTMVLRPQFWGFFFLQPRYAFAFYWQFKALLLLTGVFSFLLLLTHSSRIAAFGALWYATSPYIQWQYSWASLLPEMIGLFCVVMCAVFYMSVGRRPILLAVAAVACVSSAVNFALCSYIPQQIPLVWLGIFLSVWWISARWRSIFTSEYALPRVAALAGTWIVVGMIMFAFYKDAAPGLRVIADTVYPGRRSLPAGTYPILWFFSHFFSFWESEGRIPIPRLFGNICECSGFFWLAPVTLFCLRGPMLRDVVKKRAYAVLAAFAGLLFIWLTLPVPSTIGKALLMDKSGVSRSLHVLGLVNVALVALYLSFTPVPGATATTATGSRQRWLLAAAVFVSVYPVMGLINVSTANFLTLSQLLVAAGYVTLLIVLIVERRLKLLAVSVIVPQIAVFGLVNPLDRGLKPIESSPLFRFVHSNPELLRHRWIVYSPSAVYPGFFTAVGCDVVTGMKYVPDLEALKLFDPGGAARSVINQSGFLVAEPAYGDNHGGFEQVSLGVVKWRVSPLDPALRRIGVRYAAFTSEPPPEIAARMRPLNTQVSGFWTYELPE